MRLDYFMAGLFRAVIVGVACSAWFVIPSFVWVLVCSRAPVLATEQRAACAAFISLPLVLAINTVCYWVWVTFFRETRGFPVIISSGQEHP